MNPDARLALIVFNMLNFTFMLHFTSLILTCSVRLTSEHTLRTFALSAHQKRKE